VDRCEKRREAGEARRPDEGDVDAEAAVRRRAVDAEEDAVGDGRPRRVLGVAIEAHLHACTAIRNGIRTHTKNIAQAALTQSKRKCDQSRLHNQIDHP
jgi:hypothetical protein